MKKALFTAAALMIVFCTTESYAGGRYGGYGGRKGYSSYPSYTPAPQRNYSHGGEIYVQKGYPKSNSTYVMPHYKTRPDNYKWNNLESWEK